MCIVLSVGVSDPSSRFLLWFAGASAIHEGRAFFRRNASFSFLFLYLPPFFLPPLFIIRIPLDSTELHLAPETKIRYTANGHQEGSLLKFTETDRAMMTKNKRTEMITLGGMIAALYVVLTYVASALGLASGAIQVRLSECLTILPVLTGAAVPGLTVGCVLANLLTGCAALDVVFGSLATLLGALGTRVLRNRPALAWIPPVVSNMIIVPLVLIHVYHIPDVSVSIPFTDTVLSGTGFLPLMITVGIGEVISCGILGLLVYKAARRSRKQWN